MTNYDESLESHLSGTAAILQDFIRSCFFAFGYSVATDKEFDLNFVISPNPALIAYSAGFWREMGNLWLAVNAYGRNNKQLDITHFTLSDWRGWEKTNKIQLTSRNNTKYATEDILLAQQFLDTWFPKLQWSNRYTFCESSIHGSIKDGSIYRTLCGNHHGRYICDECAKHLSLDVRVIPDEPKRSKTEREKLTPSLRWQILDKYACTCQGCGRKPPEVKVHVDHKIPIAQGGKTEVDNLHVLCEKCNFGKSDKMPSQKTMELWGMAAD